MRTSTASAPPGVVLGSDEQVVARAAFRSSILLPHKKLTLALTNRRLAGQKPTLLFELLPVGTDNLSYPLPNIVSVQTGNRFSNAGVFVAAVFLFGAFLLRNNTGGQLALAALGIVLLVASYETYVLVTNSGTGEIRLPISLLDRAAARPFCELVNTAIANLQRTEPTYRASAPAGPDMTDQLRKLAELRDSGVLTTAEFDAKKSEILQRL